jgi:hypothetical protein
MPDDKVDLFLNTPCGCNVMLFPRADSTKVQAVYCSDDTVLRAFACKYVILEGWLEYAAGKWDPDPAIKELLESI